MSQRRKRVLAIGLGLLWGLLLLLRILNLDEPQRVPLKYKSGQTAEREVERVEEAFGTLVQPLTAQAVLVPFKTPKNIFAPLENQEKSARKKIAAARANSVEQQGSVEKPTQPDQAPVHTPPSPPSPEEMSRQQARQRLAQYRFVGYLTQGGEAKAFLGKGRELYVVKTGDLLDERVRVHTIAASSVTLVDAATSVEATILLSQDGSSIS